MAQTKTKPRTKAEAKADSALRETVTIAAPAPAAGHLPSVDERMAAGKALRETVPREIHGDWKPQTNRRNPVDILQEQDKTRIEALLPIRYGRMLQTPFAFLRGSAAVMAADLAHTPASGIHVQVCGD